MSARFWLLYSFVFLSHSVMAGNLIVKTWPAKSDVYVVQPNSGQEFKVGKTPIVLSEGEVFDKIDGSFYIVRIKRTGYEPYSVFVAKTRGSDIEIQANLQLPSDQSTKIIDSYVENIFEAQRLIQSKNFPLAHQSLDKLLKKYPSYSKPYELKGDTFYLQKKLKNALYFYRKAYKANPENKEAGKMVGFIRRQLGLK